MNRRLTDALTQDPARPTHFPRFGKTLTKLTSRETAAPRESSHGACQKAELHCMPAFSVAINGDLACFARGVNVGVAARCAIKRDLNESSYPLGHKSSSRHRSC